MSGTQESRKSESVQNANQPTSTSRAKLTQERVRELFDYRNGRLIRKTNASTSGKLGQEAGSINAHGYVVIGINRKLYGAHRIIWLWHYGYLPENHLDHINRDRTDNRLENLREASAACNIRNTGNWPNNTSGVKGVCFHRASRKWFAHIMVSGRQIYLGYHADFLEAVCHRLAAEQALDWSGCDDNSPAFKYVKENILDR